MAASGIIGTFQGVRSPGNGLCPAAPLHGEIDGVFRRWGLPRGGMGGVSGAIARAAIEAGVEIRTETPVPASEYVMDAPRASFSTAEKRFGRQPCRRALTRAGRSGISSAKRTCRPTSCRLSNVTVFEALRER